MDDPALGDESHRAALRALSRVHILSGCRTRIRSALDRRFRGERGTLRVLDVASGGGDLALDVARWGRDRGRRVRVVGTDISPRALDFAAARARSAGLEIAWVEADALSDLPAGPFDLVISSLFLHHLPDASVTSLLATAAARSRHLVIEDLRRSHVGLALAWGGLRLLSRSHVTHIDGPRSVRAAWRADELATLARGAGLVGGSVRKVWPQRLVLEWSER